MMATREDEKAAALRVVLSQAFGVIGAAVEVMQASAIITRALADLLDERGLLALAEVRERTQLMAEVLALEPGIVTAMEHILADDGSASPVVLN
mgnify:CR=1 FL=1